MWIKKHFNSFAVALRPWKLLRLHRTKSIRT